jgi:hypothetical protein
MRYVGGDEPVQPENADNLALRPFLFGPEHRSLAASYERNRESSVWLLPADIPDPYPWVIEALREWSNLYPDRFPTVPDWQDAPRWRTAQEVDIAAEKATLTDSFTAQFEMFQREMARLDEASAALKVRADRYERALLRADGSLLSDAVACALADLGFHVVDMDQHWPPGDRREDLRVFDEGDPDWVAIVEVKGSKGGTKETDLQAFGRWAERYILDHHQEPSGRWLVTNHSRHVDPDRRSAPFANKPQVLATFSKSNGTVLDTRALFDLLRLTADDPAKRSAARALLKATHLLIERVGDAQLGDAGAPPVASVTPEESDE